MNIHNNRNKALSAICQVFQIFFLIPLFLAGIFGYICFLVWGIGKFDPSNINIIIQLIIPIFVFVLLGGIMFFLIISSNAKRKQKEEK